MKTTLQRPSVIKYAPQSSAINKKQTNDVHWRKNMMKIYSDTITGVKNISGIEQCGIAERLVTKLKENGVIPPEQDVMFKKNYFYLPLYNEVSVRQVIDKNSSRILSGKEPYPIVLADPKLFCNTALAALAKNKSKDMDSESNEKRFQKLGGCLTKELIKINYNKNPDKFRSLGRYLALKKTQYIRLDEVNPSSLGKLYIAGYGKPEGEISKLGKYTLENFNLSTANLVTKDLLPLLTAAGLPVDIRMLQMESAESADSEKPLAQYMSNALSDAGVPARVFGYRGTSVLNELHHIHSTRAVKNPIDNNFIKYDLYRASDVRQEFLPQKKSKKM
ncbi:hypothetical protein PL78_05005 [Yersinia entomophaga]|uniref:Uncharacterized protein n=1 Tax=Yersinia entomophaga TaxID=935293 RepID=A0ABN4PPR4_YERET|nr:hypothetical protein [Yersinia entomophaga]ANI29198.1 hypothetical protein PL78_05005 [Yersinia entomophaga]OWF89190.1 hypothetical protein B4914_04755 [Yersinia entomophaga]